MLNLQQLYLIYLDPFFIINSYNIHIFIKIDFLFIIIKKNKNIVVDLLFICCVIVCNNLL